MTFDGWVDHLMREMLDAFPDDWLRVREPRHAAHARPAARGKHPTTGCGHSPPSRSVGRRKPCVSKACCVFGGAAVRSSICVGGMDVGAWIWLEAAAGKDAAWTGG